MYGLVKTFIFRLKINVNFTIKYAVENPIVAEILFKYTNPNNPLFFQFLLDSSVIPEVINAVQLHGEQVLYLIFKVSRTWCYSLHRKRLKLLGRWNLV